MACLRDHGQYIILLPRRRAGGESAFTCTARPIERRIVPIDAGLDYVNRIDDPLITLAVEKATQGVTVDI
jgi:hypothetical protein